VILSFYISIHHIAMSCYINLITIIVVIIIIINFMLLLCDISYDIVDFTVARGSIAINTTDVDVMWNKLQTEVHVYVSL